MASVKNLSLSQIKKQDAQKYKNKKQIMFDDGNTKVDVDLVFRPSKRNEVIANLLKLIQGKTEKEESVTGDTITAVMLCLIIKHFSSIDVKGADDFDDYLEMFQLLTDNNYLSPILQGFDPQELQSCIDEVNKQIANWTIELNKILEELQSSAKVDDQDDESETEQS